MENGGGFTGGVFTNMAIYNPTLPIDGARHRDEPDEVLRDRTARSGRATRSRSPSRSPIARPENRDPRQRHRHAAPHRRPHGADDARRRLLELPSARPTSRAPARSAPSSTAWRARRSAACRTSTSSSCSPHAEARRQAGARGRRRLRVQQVQQQRLRSAVTQGFVTDAFEFNNLGGGHAASSPAPFSYIQESKLVSFFSRANYGYADKYFLTGVVRRDGSSRLGGRTQVVGLPGLSALVAHQQRGLHAGRRFSDPRAARGLGTAGQPGGAAVRHAAAARDRRRRASIRSAAAITTRAFRRRRSRTPTSSGRRPSRRTSDSTGASRTTGSPASIDVYQKNDEGPAAHRPVPQPAVVSHADPERRLGAEPRSRGDARRAAVRRGEQVADVGSRALRRAQQGHRPRRRAVHRRRAASPVRVSRAATRSASSPASRSAPSGAPKFLARERQRASRSSPAQATSTGCTNGETIAPTGDDEHDHRQRQPEVHARSAQQRRAGPSSTRAGCGAASSARDVFNNTALVYSTKGNAKSATQLPRVGARRPDRHQRAGDLLVALDRERTVRPPAERHARLHVHAAGCARRRRTTRVYVSGDNLLLFTPYIGLRPRSLRRQPASPRAASIT